MMEKLIPIILIIGLFGCAAGFEKTEAPPAPPPARYCTDAEVTAGTSTTPCVATPKQIGDTYSGATAEVSDATIAVAGDTDTSHAYSKDDIHDYLVTDDTDLDATIADEDMTWTGTHDFTGATVTYEADSIKDTGIDWGSGAGQVDMSDFPVSGSWSPTGTLDISGATVTFGLAISDLPAMTISDLNTWVSDATLLDDGAIGDANTIGLTTGDNYTNYGDISDDSINELFSAIDTALSSLGGDMTKAVYDSGSNNKVDDADAITASDSGNADATWYPIVADGATGTQAMQTDSGLSFNPYTNVLTVSGGWATGTANNPLMTFDETDGTDWQLRVDDVGNSFEIGSSQAGVGDNVEFEIDEDGDIHVTGDVYITGDDLFMNTNTDGLILVADGTNFNPVQAAGDVEIANDGTTTIQADSVADTMVDWGSGAGQVEITDVPATAWRVFYSDGSGVTTELALGASGKVLKSNGASAAPTWEDDSTGAGSLGSNLSSSTDDILSDNGTILLGGTGGSNNETLDIDFESTANTIAFSSTSSATELDLGSFQMVTTGDIMGGVNISSKTAATYTVGTDDAHEAYGTLFINGDNDAIDFTLPSAVAGMSACFMQGQGVSGAVTVQPNTGDYLVVDGSRGTAATDYTSTGDGGDKLCVIAIDATDWVVTSLTGTWAEP